MSFEMFAVLFLGLASLIVGFFYFREWGKAIMTVSKGPIPPYIGKKK